MKKLVLIFLTLFVASSVWAYDYDFKYDGLCYKITEEETVSVTCENDHYDVYFSEAHGTPAYSNLDQNEIVIPTSVVYEGKTYRVTSVGSAAFKNCTSLTSITIPEGVMSIGEGAFQYCNRLTSITIPDGVTSIGARAFEYCYGLTSISIPESVTSYGSYVFGWLSQGEYGRVLSSLTIPESFEVMDDFWYLEIDGIKYEIVSGKEVSVVSINYSGDIVIPSTVTAGNTFSVTSIDRYAFYRNEITSITLPEDLDVSEANIKIEKDGIVYRILNSKEVGVDHPENSGKDEYLSGSVVIPPSVVLGNNTYEVTKLLSLWLSPNLVSLTIPNTITFDELNNTTLGGLKEYHGPADFIEKICYESENDFLEIISITNGTLSRDGLDFINLSYRTLKEIDLSGIENTEIPDMAFNNCYKLEKVTLPSRLESIGYKSFAGCTALEGISIPASVTKIDNSAFEDCRSMSKIVFDGSELKASTSNLETIGKWAFYNCHNLQNLEIPEGVTFIGDAAFYGCTYLQDLQLPSTLKSLGDNTFALCENLKSLTVLAENPPSLYEKSFYNVDHTIPVSVPESSLKSYAETDYWKEFIHLKSTDDKGGSQGGEGGNQTAINGVSNATTVTIENNQILVNGEAPAFVVTVSGKKIVNLNLKSGVYFVNVEGKTVKVSVK